MAGWERGRLDEFSKWRTMAFVVDIGRSPHPSSRHSYFVLPPVRIHFPFHVRVSLFFSLPPSLIRPSLRALEASCSQRCGKSGNPTPTGAIFLSLSTHLFINRDIYAPSEALRRRDNRSRLPRYVSRLCPDRENVSNCSNNYIIYDQCAALY